MAVGRLFRWSLLLILLASVVLQWEVFLMWLAVSVSDSGASYLAHGGL
jgi:hypothetical protein